MRDRQSTMSTAKLTLESILDAALAIASDEGLGGLSMRRLGRELSVEAMSLYHHVANKDALLGELADRVVREIQRPEPGEPWRAAMRRRAQSAWKVFRRYPFAIGLLESRADPGPESLAYYDAVLGCLRASGFSLALAGHAFSALDSYIYGFALQHAKMPFQTGEELMALADQMLPTMPADRYPHLREFVEGQVLQPGYAYEAEFEHGLELLLDGLERRLQAT